MRFSYSTKRQVDRKIYTIIVIHFAEHDWNHISCVIYSETCLDRPHVRAVAQDRWSLFADKINMILKGSAIEIAEFFVTE